MSGLALLLLVGCGSPQQTPMAEPMRQLHGESVTDHVDLPDAVLTDTSGHDYRLASTPTAPLVLIVFGYSNCDPRCSTSPSLLADALTRLSTVDRGRVNAILITVDPARDTPMVLRDWLADHAPGVIGLTSDRGTIRHVAERIGIAISGKQHRERNGYFVGHGTQIIAFGPERTAIATWNSDVVAADLADDLHQLATR